MNSPQAHQSKSNTWRPFWGHVARSLDLLPKWVALALGAVIGLGLTVVSMGGEIWWVLALLFGGAMGLALWSVVPLRPRLEVVAGYRSVVHLPRPNSLKATEDRSRPCKVRKAADDLRTSARDTGYTIEERLEIEATRFELELTNEPVAVPIGGMEGRYLIRQLLGRGGMGAVYLADDLELERRVAIKVVAARLDQDESMLRLRREARALAQLDHPNVVRVFDIGHEGEERFIAMEYVPGPTLREWQRGRRRDEVLDAYVEAGRGLAAAHARGLVHRDVKPDNVLVNEEDSRLRVRVVGFGLAVWSTAQVAGRFAGTLAYMAPEQLRREQADARSDQHQFCVALWEAIAGKRTFGDHGRALEGDVSVPARPSGMPRWVYRVLKRGLAFDPRDRYPSMDELLGAITWGRRLQRLRFLGAGATLVAAAVLVVFGVFKMMQPDPCVQEAARLDAQWNAEARAEVEAAFVPWDETHGTTMSRYLVDHMNVATDTWSSRAKEVCAAGLLASPGEQHLIERRRACLRGWADRIEQRIAWLRQPEDDRMAQANAMVDLLVLDDESCRVAPFGIAESVERVLEEAEQAEVLRDLDDALRLANGAVALAEAQGRPCAVTGSEGEPRSSELAAAWFRVGHVLAERGETSRALEALDRAHIHSRACGDEHRDADARTLAAKVLAVDVGDVVAAELALDEAWVALQHVEEPETSLRRYEQRLTAGLVAEYAGDREAARRYAEQALQALGDPGEHPLLAARAMINVGVSYEKEGRLADSATAYDKAVALVGGALGAEHPITQLYVARRALNLGLAAQERNAFDEMRRYFAQAKGSSETTVVVKTLTAWAQGEFMATNYGAAISISTELLNSLESHPYLSPKILASAETTAGQILAALEDPSGIQTLKRACARWPAVESPNERAMCEVSLANALLDAEQEQAARDTLQHLNGLEVNSTELRQAIDELSRRLGEADAPTPSIVPP